MVYESRKVIKCSLTKDTSVYQSITAKFEAEKFAGYPLADTYVELDIPRFCITWEDKEKMMEELAYVISNYAI